LSVFVLDQRKRPVIRCSEKRARLLVERGRAVVHRRYPFTIRLNDGAGGDVEPVRVKLNPGSSRTGIAVVADEDGNKPARVLCPFELAHRGRQISEALTAGRAFRRRRRKRGLLPHRGDGTRFASRRLHTHQVRSRLPNRRHGASRGANRQEGRDPPWTCRGSSQRLFASGQCRRNQRQVPQTSPSRGRLLLRPATALPPRPEERGLKRGRL
jgi:hypothetical protein